MRALVAAALVALAACDASEPPVAPVDPVAAAMRPVPPGQVGLFNFRDKVMFTNNTGDTLTDCVVTIDGTIRGEIQKVGAGVTVTMMRTRFEPYTEADEFYRRGSINKNSVECTTPSGRSKVTFGGQFETTVVIPPK